MTENAPSIGVNPCQERALELLLGGSNAFLTGAPGTGKSWLVRHFLEKCGGKYAKLASTGVAAWLIDGRTLHSFFGIGPVEGIPSEERRTSIVREAIFRARPRLMGCRGIIIDEVSMVSDVVFEIAEEIARVAKGSDRPWGGLQIVAVGDFRQLPPVNRHGETYCFESEAWSRSEFEPALLRTPMRSSDPTFLSVLTAIRGGVVNKEVTEFLDSRRSPHTDKFDGTMLYGLRVDTEAENLKRLASLRAPEREFPTIYWAQSDAYLEQVKRLSPFPESGVLKLKEGALIMMRRNDTYPFQRWVNGSLGIVCKIRPDVLTIALHQGGIVNVEPVEYAQLNGAGMRVATATNFPVSLAYATTIHKSQGQTIDKVRVDLSKLWAPGQAYVAMSRVRTPAGLFITNWEPKSIRSCPRVTAFHQRFFSQPRG